MPTQVRSHAKINLGLAIGAPRPDGFHGLATVYQTLAIHDFVTVAARRTHKTALKLTSNDERVPADERNTAWKMISLALDRLGIAAEVDIHIEKQLPVQGGLGAGSANAVAALVGLWRELGISAEASEYKELWMELAARVGSDVPLFLIGGTVLGVDRGQIVHALPDLEPVWCVVVAPEVGVSTAQAFRDWDALCAREGLTSDASADKLMKLSRAYVSAFGGSLPEDEAGSSGVLSSWEDLAGRQKSALVRTGITSWIVNDFERVVFPQHPSLADIKRVLAASGTPETAIYAALSGSGSALFGLYASREDAEAAAGRVNRLAGVKARCTITRTLPRDEYWGGMIVG